MGLSQTSQVWRQSRPIHWLRRNTMTTKDTKTITVKQLEENLVVINEDIASYNKMRKAIKQHIKDMKRNKLDDFKLGVFKRFEEAADDLKYKRDNPIGYRHDIIIQAADKKITRLEKKIESKKGLSNKENTFLHETTSKLNRIEELEQAKNVKAVPALLSRLAVLIDIANEQLKKTEKEEEELHDDPGMKLMKDLIISIPGMQKELDPEILEALKGAK